MSNLELTVVLVELHPAQRRSLSNMLRNGKVSYMAGPLKGMKVLDLSRILAGPWLTQILSDLGAEVWKIERPGSGDDTRHWGPPFTESGQSAYFLCANRNKRSVTLNLQHETGRDILRQVIAYADVLVENFCTGT